MFACPACGRDCSHSHHAMKQGGVRRVNVHKNTTKHRGKTPPSNSQWTTIDTKQKRHPRPKATEHANLSGRVLKSRLCVCFTRFTLPKRSHRPGSTWPGCTESLCWRWEHHPSSTAQQNWSTLIRNCCVHQRTVPKSLHVLSQSLKWTAPSHSADF